VAKVKAQSAGDVNRVLPALKDNATIEDNRKQFTSIFKVIINFK
jgi:peptidyl-prolyl cis-trans isomerase D